MHISSAGLLAYKRDVYSQTGEDGIIAKIIEMLPCKDKWCVEFGAADGEVADIVREALNRKKGEKYEYMLLGCTHYPLVLPVIEAEARNVFGDIQCIDPA